MTSNENWVQRLRDFGRKPLEDVQTTGRHEKMTSTQAYRYRELRNLRRERARPRPAAPADKPYYSLAEASARLSISIERLLELAAEGRLRCYTSIDGLKGTWRPGPPAGGGDRNRWLTVPADACRDIAAYGSANVAVLEHCPEDGRITAYALDDVLWVDPARLALKHPLPRD